MRDELTQAEADAEIAHAFFMRLLAKGIAHTDAVTMTTSYMSSTLVTRNRPPWGT